MRKQVWKSVASDGAEEEVEVGVMEDHEQGRKPAQPVQEQKTRLTDSPPIHRGNIPYFRRKTSQPPCQLL
jgi:hypothetical protein